MNYFHPAIVRTANDTSAIMATNGMPESPSTRELSKKHGEVAVCELALNHFYVEKLEKVVEQNAQVLGVFERLTTPSCNFATTLISMRNLQDAGRVSERSSRSRCVSNTATLSCGRMVDDIIVK